jgi:hypothetical protein
VELQIFIAYFIAQLGGQVESCSPQSNNIDGNDDAVVDVASPFDIKADTFS